MPIRIVYAIENEASWFPDAMTEGSRLDNGHAVYEVLEIVPKGAGRMRVYADFVDLSKDNPAYAKHHQKDHQAT